MRIAGAVVLLILCGCATRTPAPDGMRLFQVILNVRDMNRQVAFYRDVLGFRVLYPGGVEDYGTASFVRLRAGDTLLALHPGRTQPNHGQEPRLSFRVADAARTREELLRRGVAAGEIRSPAPGIRIVDARDPEGNAFHVESHERDPFLPARG